MYNFPNNPLNGQAFTPVVGGPSYVYDGVVWRITSGGVAGVWIGDTPPVSPVAGQLWFQSSTGNTFIWYPDGDSSQWVQFNVAPLALQDHIQSTPADMYAGFRGTATQFVVNDKVDGSGTDVFKVNDVGTVSSTGPIIADNTIYFSNAFGAGQAYVSMDATNGVLNFASGVALTLHRPTGDWGLYSTGGIRWKSVNASGSFIIPTDFSWATGAGGAVSSHFIRSDANGTVINFDTNRSIICDPSGNWAMFSTGGVRWQSNNATGDFAVPTTGTKPGGGTWSAPSDIRIKTVSGPYESGLQAVLELNPVRYQYKANLKRDADSSETEHAQVTGKEFIGLVAQEAEVPMPEMVTQGPGIIDGVEVDDLRTIDSGPLIFALINAVKELSARIEALEGGTR